MKQIIRINCRTKEILKQPEGETFKRLGGRGIISHIMLTETDPKTDPLGGGNKLILAGMLIAGTPAPTVNRLSVGGKSPLTKGIKESNVGGAAGAHMASHGIKALIFEELPEDRRLQIFRIKKDGECNFENAEFLRGKGNYEASELLYEKYGKKCSLILNGVAGERGYLNSAILVSETGSGYPCRAAARGGLGAVMGSKGLKAIVIEKSESRWKEYADEEKFNLANKELARSILKSRSFLSEAGTAGFVAATTLNGIMPRHNFDASIMTEEQQKIFNVQAIVGRIRKYGGKTGAPCQAGCIVCCSNTVNDKGGVHLTSGFEYETLSLFGPNCDIYDVEPIFQMDRFCDDFGFDTIESATSVAVLMDAGKIGWGDSKAVLDMFDGFWEEGNQAADDFGMGTERLGKKAGAKHIPTVKGQSIAAYEPRNLKGTGTTYAISPMGADHTCGPTLSRSDVPFMGKEGQVDASISMMAFMAACDCNACILSWRGIADAGEAYAAAVNAVLGYDYEFADIIRMGKETIERERMYNRLAGFTKDDDKLPKFFYNEPSVTGSVYDVPQIEIDIKWHGLTPYGG